MMTNLESLCNQVCDLARNTGRFIRNEAPKIRTEDVESKGVHNYVTYVDRAAEELIVNKLQELLPEAGFIVEEESIQKTGQHYQWIVDPLDGTTNFIHGIPCYSVSIALMHEQRIVLGVIYEANLEECFYAWQGGGAWLNGSPIKVSGATSLEQALLVTGFPYYDYSLLERYMELFTWCLKHTHGVRRLGSAAVDLAWVACGRFESFFEYGLNAWDVAAGSLIVHEAGGRLCDFSGKDHYIFGREIVASAPGVHDELMEKVREVFS